MRAEEAGRRTKTFFFFVGVGFGEDVDSRASPPQMPDLQHTGPRRTSLSCFVRVSEDEDGVLVLIVDVFYIWFWNFIYMYSIQNQRGSAQIPKKTDCCLKKCIPVPSVRPECCSPTPRMYYLPPQPCAPNKKTPSLPQVFQTCRLSHSPPTHHLIKL
jgi:hypothetical protein